MEQSSNNIVDIHYLQTGAATAVNVLGMREMQALAYEARDKRFLLIKAPPASGKSRALMFIALDKLVNQSIKKVVPICVTDSQEEKIQKGGKSKIILDEDE